MTAEIICVGEVLWDSLPAGLFPGGAPFNVAIHLHQVGREAAMVSRVGDDVLGEEVMRRLRERGLSAEFIQVDPQRPTGLVQVTTDESGEPSYDIREPAAWDAIEMEPALEKRAAEADAMVFGSLAQRNSTSRRTIRGLLDRGAPGVFDVNLRPPYDDRDVVEASLQKTRIVKMNEEELERLSGWFELGGGHEAAMRALSGEFDCPTVCVTRGERGAVLLHEDRLVEHGGYRVETEDAVGAGDAFLAGLLDRLLSRDASAADALDHACLLGAYVAGCSGATPAIDESVLDDIRARSPE
ncbi:MAG: carbohydrate kinase [Planctomycetota bacterium]